MTKKQKILCNTIIHSASAGAASVGAGLAQIPTSDSAVIVPIQLAMTVSLGKVFGIKLSRASAKSAMGTGMTTLIGRATSQVLVGWIPGAGNVINAATAASITEALGWILAKEFEDEANKLNGVPLIEESDISPEDDNTLIEYPVIEETSDSSTASRLKAITEIGKQINILRNIRHDSRKDEDK